MKLAYAAVLVSLAGCASPEYVASRSNFDVCRLSMGGPHAQLADAEAARRGLDCRQYYGAIAAQRQADAALLRAVTPAPAPAPVPAPATNCTSRVVGNTIQTNCN